jgi:acetyltransferase
VPAASAGVPFAPNAAGSTEGAAIRYNSPAMVGFGGPLARNPSQRIRTGNERGIGLPERTRLMQHHLRPLLLPQSVAVVGASDQAGSVGANVFRNMLAGNFKGELYAVNPHHRRVAGRRSYASLGTLGRTIDLAVIAAPHPAVPGILADPRASMRAAVLMSSPDESNLAAAKTWRRDVAREAARRGIRIVGPGSFGIIRTDLGLNATFGTQQAHTGRLALLSQSGAVVTALLDFAAPMGIGFSSVVALGGGMDVDFGELLDALLTDPATEGILLYVESVGDARRFLSALRAAARTKPVIVLKAGRSLEPRGDDPGAPTHDAVFGAALMRAGTVRVATYTQLFAAARILATRRIPRGDRLAIVTNGRGPGLLAADSAAGNDVTLARLTRQTVEALHAVLPRDRAHVNPVDVRADATPERLAAAVAATLSDPNVDAVAVLHVPCPAIAAPDAARAVAGVARGAGKPVLGAWLGAIEQPELRAILEAGGIANFFTPENAVEAFSFLAAYRRNQQWLLEVPSPQPDPVPPDLAAAEAVRTRALNERRTELRASQARALLAAFGIKGPDVVVVETLTEAQAAARRLRYPVMLALDMPLPSPVAPRHGIANGRALARAWGALLDEARVGAGAAWSGDVIVRRSLRPGLLRDVALSVRTDPVFGPVVALGASIRPPLRGVARPLMLPPLNRRLAADLIAGAHEPQDVAGHATAAVAGTEPLIRLLLQISTLVCALPWVREIELDPVEIDGDAVTIATARIAVDPKRAHVERYQHMAIHPYPAELATTEVLPDGTKLQVRPVRPEDAEHERRFVNALSEQTRYFRFFYHLHQLTPEMLARFTQVDYDRELALVVLAPDPAGPGGQKFIGVARYIVGADPAAAEFAIVTADDWQGRGVGAMLMQRLIDCAKRRGLARLEGIVLRANHGMLRFTDRLGFVTRDDEEDPEQVRVELGLGAGAAA